jgi:fibronectin-binding autotransporter adhesin
MKFFCRAAAGFAWLLVACILPSSAATITWDAVGGNTWDTGGTANWSGSTWADGDDAIFGAAGAGAVTVIGGVVTARTLTFDSTGYTVNGGTITLPNVPIGGTPSLAANEM